jgi:hypothetical protein
MLASLRDNGQTVRRCVRLFKRVGLIIFSHNYAYTYHYHTNNQIRMAYLWARIFLII